MKQQKTGWIEKLKLVGDKIKERKKENCISSDHEAGFLRLLKTGIVVEKRL